MAVLDYIRQCIKAYSQLVHASKIIGKFEGKLTKSQKEALEQMIPKYGEYLRGNLRLKGFSPDIVSCRVQLLNEYYNFLSDSGFDYLFTSQSKFRPTILEEFMFLIFKDLVEKINDTNQENMASIQSGSVKAYTNMFFIAKNLEQFRREPQVEIHDKDQDFAIYRELDVMAGTQKHLINIPVVAIENKTYIDKTMLEGAIATAEKLKTGSPYSMFAVVAETYDVKYDVDPIYSKIDQIYVLRKQRRDKNKGSQERTDIQIDVVQSLFEDVQNHLNAQWSDIESNLTQTGRIICRSFCR